MARLEFLSGLLGMDFTGEGGGGAPMHPCDGHGTQVAGVIRAQLNNNIGVAGLAPACTIASARVGTSCDDDGGVSGGGSGTIQPRAVIDGLEWAVRIGARITNHSYFFAKSAALTEKFVQTSSEDGLIHFAAAGNSSAPPVLYPASLESVMGVSAIDGANCGLAFFSSYGPGLDFAAPGITFTTDITGDWSIGYYAEATCNDYVPVGGTSTATPYAAGVAALILSVNPSLSSEQVLQIMRDTAIDLDPPGYDPQYGWGFVNAYNAVVKALPKPADLNGDGDVDGFDLALLLGQWTGAASYSPCPPHFEADLNADCKVNGFDLALLLGAWG